MRDFTIASTTDTMEDVNAAAGVVPDEEPEAVEITSEGETEAEATPETEPAPDTGKPEKPKQGKGRFSKRIDELTRERYEAQAEAARLREELAKIQVQPKPESPAKLAAPEGKPLRSSFTSDEDWVEAIAAWKADLLFTQRERQAAEQERQQRDQNAHATYMERADQYTTEHPDFNQVIAGIRIAEDVAPGVQAAIMGRPNGPEVAYYLGTHPDVCEELSQMNPADAVAEVGAISVALRQPSPKPAARIATPITPVSGSSRTARDPSDMSYQEYKAWRKANRA